MNRGRRAVHPLLLAAYPALLLYSMNAAELTPAVLWRPLLFSVGGAAAAWAALALLLRDRGRAALVTSVWVILFFTYGWAYQWAYDHLHLQHRTMLPLWALLALAALAWGWRLRRRPSPGLHRTLDVASAALVCGVLLALAGAKAMGPAERPAPPRAVEPVVAPASGSARPDVWWLILDSFASDSTLREYYAYDDRDFLDSLRARGFWVAGASRSNYPKTLPSVASALNMDYVQRFLEPGWDKVEDVAAFHALIRDSRVSRALARYGYRTEFLNPPWEMFLGDFDFALWNVTPLSYWATMSQRRRQTLQVFLDVERLAAEPGPKFVYAHVVCPHPPFVFDSAGRAVLARVDPGTPKPVVAKLYVDQLKFTARRALAALDTVLAHGPDAIVIVQADHGPMKLMTAGQPDTTIAKERFRILNAYRVPPAVRAHLYPSISPVNSFRAVLDGEFGLRYAAVPDSSFWYDPKQHVPLLRVQHARHTRPAVTTAENVR